MDPITEALGHPRGGAAAEKAFTFQNLRRTIANGPLCDFSAAFDPGAHNAYIHGPVGSGKTHAATALAGAHGGWVVKPSHLFRIGRRLMRHDVLDEGDLIGLLSGRKISVPRYYVPCPKVLVLDDLGTEKLTDWAEGFMYELVDRRMSEGVNGLVVTSNLNLDELTERFGSDRIPSRLASICRVFSLKGEPDGRVKRAR